MGFLKIYRRKWELQKKSIYTHTKHACTPMCAQMYTHPCIFRRVSQGRMGIFITQQSFFNNHCVWKPHWQRSWFGNHWSQEHRAWQLRNFDNFTHSGSYIDGLVQDCSISNSLAIEILQPCTQASIIIYVWAPCLIINFYIKYENWNFSGFFFIMTPILKYTMCKIHPNKLETNRHRVKQIGGLTERSQSPW